MGAFFSPILFNRDANEAEVNAFIARMQSQCMTTLAERMQNDIVPLDISPARENVVPMVWDDPNDRVEGHVYTGAGQRIFLLESTRTLVTYENGTFGIVTVDDQNIANRNGSSVIHRNEQSQEFINGANRRLEAWLRSVGGGERQHFLMDGHLFTRSFDLNPTIHKVNYNLGNGRSETIYVSITAYRTGWWIFGQSRLRAYDMNNQMIDYRNIGLPQAPPGWHMLIPGFNIFSVVGYMRAVSMFEIIETTNLRDLMQEIRHATIHPWERLICQETGLHVMTEDGWEIRVNPRTNQLTDFFGLALFNQVNGRPIVFHENDIITTNKRQQRVENGVLRDSVSIQGLLQLGVEFHMAVIPTLFGDFNVPVRNHGTVQNPDWRFLNGDRTDGEIIPMRDSQVLNTYQGFWEGLRNFFGGLGGSSFFRTLMIIGLVILAIIMLPVLIPVITAIGSAIGAVFGAITNSIRNISRRRRYNNSQRRNRYRHNKRRY